MSTQNTPGASRFQYVRAFTRPRAERPLRKSVYACVRGRMSGLATPETVFRSSAGRSGPSKKNAPARAWSIRCPCAVQHKPANYSLIGTAPRNPLPRQKHVALSGPLSKSERPGRPFTNVSQGSADQVVNAPNTLECAHTSICPSRPSPSRSIKRSENPRWPVPPWPLRVLLHARCDHHSQRSSQCDHSRNTSGSHPLPAP